MKNRSVSVLVPSPWIAALLVLSVVGSQTAFAVGPQAAAPPPEQAAVATITVPAGTVIPLTLVSPIKSKSTKVGDAVRAVVAFPVTVGAQIAIPAGTYVEGVVTSLTAQTKKTRLPDVEIHFTRLLYTNGYTASLDAANTQAKNEAPDAGSPGLAGNATASDGFGPGRTRIAFYGGEGFLSRAQSSTAPTLPPLPTTGRNVVIGLMVGGAVLAVVGILFGIHHKSNADYLLFDAGWQFQMALTTPLGVDAAQVVAAAATPSR
jgi:hypothetical protein